MTGAGGGLSRNGRRRSGLPPPGTLAIPSRAAGRLKRIFVSHATADQLLLDHLVDFMVLAGVPERMIFYSSDRATGIPTGLAFGDYIRSQLTQATLVIQVVTATFLCRHYCIAELGAQWALGARSFPIVVPPLAASDVTGVLAGIQVADLAESSFEELRRLLIAEFDLDLPIGTWQRAYRHVFGGLPAIIAKLPPPPLVPRDEYDRVVLERDQARAEIARMRTCIDAGLAT